jgi:hypothetical protein
MKQKNLNALQGIKNSNKAAALSDTPRKKARTVCTLIFRSF